MGRALCIRHKIPVEGAYTPHTSLSLSLSFTLESPHLPNIRCGHITKLIGDALFLVYSELSKKVNRIRNWCKGFYTITGDMIIHYEDWIVFLFSHSDLVFFCLVCRLPQLQNEVQNSSAILFCFWSTWWINKAKVSLVIIFTRQRSILTILSNTHNSWSDHKEVLYTVGTLIQLSDWYNKPFHRALTPIPCSLMGL